MHTPFVQRVKFKFLAQFPVDHFFHPILSTFILFFCTNLHDLIIILLIVSSLSPHNLHMLFCCILSIFAFLMLLFSGAIRKYSVSLLRFPVLSHVQVFWCEILLVCPYSSFFSHFCFLVIAVLLLLALYYYYQFHDASIEVLAIFSHYFKLSLKAIEATQRIQQVGEN